MVFVKYFSRVYTMSKDIHCWTIKSIFEKVGRIASENVIIEMLYYSLKACPVNKSQIKLLHFAINIVYLEKVFLKSYNADKCMSFYCSVFDAIIA